MKTQILNINGERIETSIDPDMPLLYALRGELGKTGTRFGCGEGMCGACTVIVDGKMTLSCDVPVSAVEGCAIETIEGLSKDGGRHPIVMALIEGQAGQCGYCLPGIVMAAKALLDETPRPTRTQIATALDANLCRCGAHSRILKAIETAAARMAEARS